ncbi:hypothetical protein BW43_03647 [Pseudomonas sp. RIT357]|nr:hypothetical protein BW43_03647 [Pseudomonas sp. RIT357]
MKTVHKVVVGLLRLGHIPQLMHLRNPGRCRVVAVAQDRQLLQPFSPPILSSDLGKSRTDFLSNCIRPRTCPHNDPRSGSAARCTSAPLHDSCHRATHPPHLAISPKLLAPVLQQHFHRLDHRPTPRKTEPNTENPLPNTNPTQINSFKINTLINFELSVLGLLGFSVLA